MGHLSEYWKQELTCSYDTLAKNWESTLIYGEEVEKINRETKYEMNMMCTDFFVLFFFN